MRQIHPLIVVGLFIVIVLFMGLQVHRAKEELHTQQQQFHEAVYIAQKLQMLQSLFGDEKKTKRALARIVANRMFQNAHIKYKKTKTSAVLSTPSISYQALNSLMGKIFNGSFKIRQYKVVRIDDTHASFMMEIQW